MFSPKITQAETDTPKSNNMSPTEPLFETLSNPRRRAVIGTIHAEEDAITLSELVDEVAEQENDTDTDEITGAERNRVYTALYQTHLPHLDDNDVVSYDKDEKRISSTEQTSVAKQIITTATNPSQLTKPNNNRLLQITTLCGILELLNLLSRQFIPVMFLNTTVSFVITVLLLSQLYLYLLVKEPHANLE